MTMRYIIIGQNCTPLDDSDGNIQYCSLHICRGESKTQQCVRDKSIVSRAGSPGVAMLPVVLLP
jgi:hypothetical protein